MLALREAHASGPTRVSASGHHILTGGADGVVSLYSVVQWPKAAALWSFKCHEDCVTDVVLADTVQLAVSCSRDGRILMHENVHDASKLVSRMVCKMPGEVRCVQLDVAHHRVYVAGDSLRCLDLVDGRFQVQTLPMVVPGPIISLAISPCGLYVAVGSASGELGVLAASPLPSTVAASADGTKAPAAVRVAFPGVLSSSAKKEEGAMYRMTWTRTDAGGLMLMIPTFTEVQVYKLEEGTGTLTGPRVRAIGGLQDPHLTDLHAALTYRVTRNRLAVLLASREGLFIGKVEGKTLAMSRHNAQSFTNTEGQQQARAAPVTDVSVSGVTGDVVVGLADGRVSLLRRVSFKGWRPNADAVTVVDAEKDNEEEEEEKQMKGKSETAGQKQRRRAAAKSHEDSADEGDGGSDASSSESYTGSTTDASAEDEEDADSESGVVAEDFGRVVVDLERNGASRHGNDDDRPSRWRQGDPTAAMAHAAHEMAQSRVRSRFLDDEAEEGSTEDEEEEKRDGEADTARVCAQQYRRGASARAGYRDDECHEDADSLEGCLDDDAEDDVGDRTIRGAGDERTTGRLRHVTDYSFQTGATPLGEEGSCYLAYNAVGYIHCTRDATTIHFHDIAFAAVRLPLRDTVLMGALSPVGAGFVLVPAEAAEAAGSVDEAPRLTVLYHAFTPIGAQSEWRVTLMPGETVRCMAAGIRYLAVATSHYLRLFSLSGLELAVLSKAQRIVTMVGTSSRKVMTSFKANFDPLAVVSLGAEGELRLEVMDVGARAAALPSRTIPLTELPDGSTHQLQWLGWSEDGLLHTADTAGVVRLYTEDWGGTWVPVYDPRTLVDQSYALWVYAVTDASLMAYRYTREDPSYPPAVAGGLSTELVPLFLPLTRTMAEDGLERWDKVLRQQIRSDELKRHSTFYNSAIARSDEVHDHHLLQFFDGALKQQQTTRAMELAMLMEIHDRVVKCAQVANNGGYAKLVPKLLALYEMRVASKTKRRCPLPLKEALATEKKKDELLRKLLAERVGQDAKEKASMNAGPSDGEHTGHTVTEPPSIESPSFIGETATAIHTTPPPSLPIPHTPSSQVLGRVSSVTAGTSPAPSSSSAASTITTTADPGSNAGGAKRHISFAREVAPTTTASMAATNTTTPTSSTKLPTASLRKVSNPFAKPTEATIGTSPSPTSSTATTPPSVCAAIAQPARSSPAHHSAAPVQSTLAVPRSDVAAHRQTPPRASALASEAARSEVASGETSPKEGTPEGQRTSAGRTASSPILSSPQQPQQAAVRQGGSASPRAPTTKTTPSLPTFVGKALPNVASAAAVPVDPFVEAERLDAEEQASSATTTSSVVAFRGPSASAQEPAAVSVESLLKDSEAEMKPVARSDSFGEALRKRYRSDDEEDEEGGTPLNAVPRLSLSEGM